MNNEAKARVFARHPWEKYLKIGCLARKCAYQIKALDGYVYSNVQVPAAFKDKIKDSYINISYGLSKALNILSKSIKSIADPSLANIHLKKSMIVVEELKSTLKAMLLEDNSDLLGITHAARSSPYLWKSLIVSNVSPKPSMNLCKREHSRKYSLPPDHEPPIFLY